MADKVIKKLEDQLVCSICQGPLSNPKLLRCCHVFCSLCLAKQFQHYLAMFPCPVCHQHTPISGRGVAALQTAFLINQIREIVEAYHKEEDPALTAERAERAKFSPTWFCLVHPARDLELYCKTCNKVICFHCTLPSGGHHGHDYKLLAVCSQASRRNEESSRRRNTLSDVSEVIVCIKGSSEENGE